MAGPLLLPDRLVWVSADAGGAADEHNFRPSVVWRIVRDALWNANDRKRLTQAALDFLKVRAGRRKYARAVGDSA